MKSFILPQLWRNQFSAIHFNARQNELRALSDSRSRAFIVVFVQLYVVHVEEGHTWSNRLSKLPYTLLFFRTGFFGFKTNQNNPKTKASFVSSLLDHDTTTHILQSPRPRQRLDCQRRRTTITKQNKNEDSIHSIGHRKGRYLR